MGHDGTTALRGHLTDFHKLKVEVMRAYNRGAASAGGVADRTGDHLIQKDYSPGYWAEETILREKLVHFGAHGLGGWWGSMGRPW